VGIRHGFESGERLGADDEQGLVGIQVASRLDEIRAINIGNKTEGQVSLAVILQRFICHHGPKIRAADANIDHVSNSLARMAFPRPAANLPGKLRHFVQNIVNLGNNIRTIDEHLFAFGSAQCNMKNGTVLGHVDFFAGKHGVYVCSQTRLLRKINQQTERIGRDAVLRIVEVQSQSLQRKAFAASRVIGEKLAEV